MISSCAKRNNFEFPIIAAAENNAQDRQQKQIEVPGVPSR